MTKPKVLAKPVMVAGDGDPPGSPLKRLDAGTRRSDLPPSELAQLCDDHFTDG
ncbi:MAG TPA: hypothetical protein VGB14_00420 [Acidimicrobiales bacterium]|jgi:hypothetical protein